MEIEEKRKFLLDELEKFQKLQKKFIKFEKFTGPGIKRKIQRLLFCSDIYLPYLFFRLNLFPPTKNKKIKLLNYREINLNNNDFGSFIFYKYGFLNGISEYKLTKFFIKNFKEKDIFYDIGTNYGFYTYLALEFCKEVHSFEPLPEVFSTLKKNLQNELRVFLNNVAVSDQKGASELFIAGGGSTILQEVENKFKRKSKKIKVETITLNDYIKNHSKPTIIKIDVEGAESKVIEGGKEFLKNNSPIISMEVWDKNNGGEISMKAVEKLRELGYQTYFINLAGDLEKINGDLSEKVFQDNLPNDNYIFLKI